MPDWKQLTVAAPEADVENDTLNGNGWALQLTPGWQIEPTAQTGNFTLRRAK